MKELNGPIQDKPQAAEQRQVHSQKLIASIKPHKGHTMFQMEVATGIIEPAEFETVTADIHGAVTKKVIRKPGYLYASALNAKNADKKFFKLLGLQHPKGYKPPQVK